VFVEKLRVNSVRLSRVYTIHIGSSETTREDARADVSCKSHYANDAVQVISGSRKTLWKVRRVNFEETWHEMFARASSRVGSREPTCIVYMRLYSCAASLSVSQQCRLYT
jgi:hypothetical protein